MDSSLDNFNIDQLNEADKSQLRSFLNNEQQKARVQATVHSLTDICFRKCVTGSIKSGKLDRTEESCMSSCADRFLDVSKLTMTHLQNMRH
ncbi:Tim10/DDP family zinc finger protein [Xylariomycetidae sp. FL2044]|nr:Tim10/DDP family zinc finger protein [Xylariomycetidae sp. FL2044]